MSEATMALKMGHGLGTAQPEARPHEFDRVEPVGVRTFDGRTFPWLGRQTVSIGLVRVFIGKKSMLIGSAVKTHPAFIRLAEGLGAADNKKTNDLFNRSALELLRTGAFESGILTNRQAPNILIRNIGDSFSPNSLQLAAVRLPVKGEDTLIRICAYRASESGRTIRIMEQAGYKCPGDYRLRLVRS